MQVALPLLDREVVNSFTIGCLASGFLHCHVYNFMVRTHHLDLLSKLLVYHLVYLLLRNGWHSISWRESTHIHYKRSLSLIYNIIFSQPRDNQFCLKL